jgi:hypothetical protein
MQFPTNIPALTIWEVTLIDRAPAYIRHELGAAYWEDTRGQSEHGREPDDHVFLAIHADNVTYLPKKEDRVLPGSVDSAAPPRGALTVMQVKDFRYGSTMMQHVEVILK